MSLCNKVAGASIAGVLAIASPFLIDLEGKSLISYLDSGGVPTICNGIIRYPDGQPVKLGQTKTDAECDRFFEAELSKALAVVDQNVYLPLSYHQRAGLTSFVYNVGPIAFKASTVRKLLNEGNTLGACNQLRRWVFVKGKDCRIAKSNCKGIVRRRERERELCLKGE